MKLIKVDGNNIEVLNNGIGQETIKYNGEEVSKKFSLMGATHIFTVNEGGAAALYEAKLTNSWHGMSVSIQVKKNGNTVYSENIFSPSGVIGWVVSIAIFIMPIALNPSKEDHYAAMAAEYKKEHPIAAEFTPDAIFESLCKYEDHFFFSKTVSGNKTCTTGLFGKVMLND